MKLKKELPILIIVLLPFLYLAYIWQSLPEKVPAHWNLKGEIDRWGDKDELILIPFLLPAFIYLILSVVPKIDPKKRIEKMGNKFYHLKFIMVSFMSVLALYILYSAEQKTTSNIAGVFALIGFLVMVLGNYFKTLKPNYFIGIRTPWTLENESVWKETHHMAGKLWFVGGILMVLAALVVPSPFNFYVFMCITAVIVIIPLAFSYIKFKSLSTT